MWLRTSNGWVRQDSVISQAAALAAVENLLDQTED